MSKESKCKEPSNTIANILIGKLTVEELSLLCDCYGDGNLDDAFDVVLLPRDCKEHPEKYQIKIPQRPKANVYKKREKIG